LKSTISADLLDNCEKFYWDGKEKHPNEKATALPLYRNLFSCLHSLLSARKLFTSTPNDKANIMRIGIFSLASCEWGDDLCHSLGSNSTNHVWSEVTSFFALLRALARQSYTVAFVSVPSYLFVDSALLGRLSNHADYVIGLESFQGTDKEVNPLFKEYHGILHINKISAGNSLVAPFVDTHDWVFRLKRKKLSIEKLHLPPDLSETVSRSTNDHAKSTASCSGSLPNKLDF
jgi:elongator complex protein 4